MKKIVCLSLEEEKIMKLKKLSHETSIKENKEISYIDLIRKAIDIVYNKLEK